MPPYILVLAHPAFGSFLHPCKLVNTSLAIFRDVFVSKLENKWCLLQYISLLKIVDSIKRLSFLRNFYNSQSIHPITSFPNQQVEQNCFKVLVGRKLMHFNFKKVRCYLEKNIFQTTFQVSSFSVCIMENYFSIA